MNRLIRTLRKAREADPLSKEQYSYESWALGTVRAHLAYWADDTHRGEKLKGHNKVRWMKTVYARIQELNEIFLEDDKIKEEARK